MFQRKVLLMICLLPLHLSAIELMKDYLDYNEERPLPTIASDFVYGEGTSEVSSAISDYENITAGKPIRGSIFVTHETKNSVDNNSFRLGEAPLKVSFVQTTQMSSSSDIVVSIYHFELSGMPTGTYTLPSITVKVGGKEVRALPLNVQVN